jgi:hypothetical protein
MSFRHLLDHRVDIVRPAQPLVGDSLADERPVWSAVYSNVRAAFWPILAPVVDAGAGETPAGNTSAALERSVVPQDGDVIVTVSGPETPKRWRILANRSPGRRFGRPAHHREIEAEPHVGILHGYDDVVEEETS